MTLVENSITTYKIQSGLVVYQRIREYQVGRDLKVHLIQPFLAKAWSRQDVPLPC